MDNSFFEYLIIIFFIVSAIQSIFNRKKKQEKAREARQRNSSQGSSQSQNKGKEKPPDIFEEMFGLEIPSRGSSRNNSGQSNKQTKIPSDTETEVVDSSGYQETSWNPEKEFEDSVGVETVRYKQEKPTETKIEQNYKEANRKLDKKIEKARKSLQRLPDKIEVEEIGSTVQVDIIENLKSRIRDPQSMREYVLVSEILNKPKAFRR